MLKDRVKELRKELRLSQKVFGEKIGLSESAISNIEKGRYNLTDSNKKLICSIWNVSAAWLNDGTGDMYNEDPDAEVDYLIGKFMADNNLFRKKVITGMMKLTDDQWGYIEKFAREVFEAEK